MHPYLNVDEFCGNDSIFVEELVGSSESISDLRFETGKTLH